ncbi:alpha/beta hydrolase [Cytobacillus sp. IB215665]|uniref:alpha/beta hydrolase n=1 Tax=Cytobacillus sp. IB215665 TaxID=3097357 RepID=UPI002A1175C8|nr:alpha/beta hydrolase [Cytobacillus sp. IB215665]MDX8364363.1 alpha/beta hydrolase [Cytobacillus sp. IB215665]
MITLFIFIGALFTIIVITGFILTNQILYISKKDDDELYNREVNEGRFKPEAFAQLPCQKIEIQSKYNYEIHGWLIAPHQANKYMIFCHGVTVNKVNSIKYMDVFLERGWNVLAYDHRRHGESGGKTTSYGYYEKHDLAEVVNWLKKRVDHNSMIGIHGESMGAVTLLLYADMVKDGADFYIADCPFSDFEEQLVYRVKKSVNLPKQLFIPLTNLFLKWREGYSLKDISPISIVENITQPILFIHSQKDDYILPEMTKSLYKQKKGPKKLFLAQNGSHALSLAENKTAYEQVLDEFLAQYKLNT